MGDFLLFLSFFVRGYFFAPLTVFFEFNFLYYELLVFTAPVVDALTFSASKFYESFLRHR